MEGKREGVRRARGRNIYFLIKFLCRQVFLAGFRLRYSKTVFCQGKECLVQCNTVQCDAFGKTIYKFTVFLRVERVIYLKFVVVTV